MHVVVKKSIKKKVFNIIQSIDENPHPHYLSDFKCAKVNSSHFQCFTGGFILNSIVFITKTKVKESLKYPLGDVGVHHEVVDVLLGPGQLQLPGDHRHHQNGAAGAL